MGRLPRFTAVKMPRIILNAVAETEFSYHRYVLARAPFEALRFKYLARCIEFLKLFRKFQFDVRERRFLYVLRRHVVLGGINENGIVQLLDFPCNGTYLFYLRHFPARQVNAVHSPFACGHELDTRTERAECPRRELARHALEVHRDELARERCAGHRL